MKFTVVEVSFYLLGAICWYIQNNLLSNKDFSFARQSLLVFLAYLSDKHYDTKREES